MSDLRSRNNASSKKSYEKELEREHATEYELEVVRQHALLSNTEVSHWPRTPEDWLYDCGYITDYNKYRHERLMRKKEAEGGINRVRDYGFDGLARTLVDSTYVYSGIQAKYYLSKQVCASDIGSFLASQISLMLKNPLSKGYLYTTSTLQADLSGNIANPSYPIRHILHPWKHTDGRSAPKVVPIVKECDLPLRPYQLDALKQLEDKDGINALSIPCRMGKTVIAGHDARRSSAKLVVAIAPLMVSVDNLQERLTCFFPSYSSLIVDSDTGGTTNIEVIKEFLKSEGSHIIYSTFKSATDILSEILTDYENTYILADEIHNAGEDLCDFIQQFPRGLVLSATLPEEVMDMLEINHIVHIPFSQAIRDGYIVDYTLWLPHLTKKTDGTTCVDIDIPVEFAEYDADLTAKAFYLATVMLKTGSRRCIAYLSNQGQCDSFMPLVTHIFKTYHGLAVWTDKIDSSVSKVSRKKIIEEFQTGDDSIFRILTSVRILDEAVDIPRCDSVFITSFGPENDIRMTQRSQRSSTKDPLNPSKYSNIILWADGWEKCVGALDRLRESDPDFHKKVKMADCNYDRSGEVARIESVKEEAIEFGKWEGMKCLTTLEHHLKIIEEIKLFYTNYGEPKRNGKREDGKEHRFSAWMGQRRNNKRNGTLKSIVENEIEIKLPWFRWNNYSEISFNKHIKELNEFYTKYKEQPSCTGTRENEIKLGMWMSRIRKNKNNDKLDISKEKIINSELPWFIWDPVSDHHDKMIAAIKLYYEIHKKEPSTKIKEIGPYILGRRKDKKKGSLSKELETKIMINLPWFSWNPIEDQHKTFISSIKIFYQTYGREPSSRTIVTNSSNEKSLSDYICSRRKDKNKNKLDTELEKYINIELPWFRWKPTDINYERIESIREFYEKYNVQPKESGIHEDEHERKLFMYISKFRSQYKHGKISTDVERKIKEIIPWLSLDKYGEQHKMKIQELYEFYNKYDSFPINNGIRDNGNEAILARYMGTCRKDKKNGVMDPQLEKYLITILPMFSWSPIDERHHKTLKQIKEFYEKYHIEPKHNGILENGNEAKMAAYLSQRRNNKKNGDISLELEKYITDYLPWFKWETLYTRNIKHLNEIIIPLTTK